MPRSLSTIASGGPSASPCCTAASMAALRSGTSSRLSSSVPRPSFGLMPAAVERVAVLGVERGEEGAHHVPEDDRVGHLHHRGLEVHREQHALGLGSGDLLVEERAQRGDAHDRGVDDLAGQHRHRRRAARWWCRRRRPARCAAIRRPSITMDFSLDRKSSAVMWATLVFESGDHAPIECGCFRAYAFTDAGARRSELPSRSTGFTALPLHPVVASADLALLVGLRVVGVVGEGVALALQLGDGVLQLRDRRADVRQLDDVGLGRLGQLAQLGQGVGDALLRLEVVGERGDDPAGQRDVAGLDRHPGRAGVGLDDREEGVGGQQRRFVGVGVDDRRVRHRRHATGATGTLVLVRIPAVTPPP